MGAMGCSTYGSSAIAHVCPHVRDAVESGVAPQSVGMYPLKDFEGTPAAAILEFCDPCMRERGLPIPPRPVTEQVWETLGKRLDTVAVCSRCLQAARAG